MLQNQEPPTRYVFTYKLISFHMHLFCIIYAHVCRRHVPRHCWPALLDCLFQGRRNWGAGIGGFSPRLWQEYVRDNSPLVFKIQSEKTSKRLQFVMTFPCELLSSET